MGILPLSPQNTFALGKLNIIKGNIQQQKEISKIFNSSKKTKPKTFDMKIKVNIVDMDIKLRDPSIPSIKLVELIMYTQK